MAQITKLFTIGADQAVRLPLGFEFEAQEVFIRKDATTGDVILSRRHSDWLGFLDAVKNLDIRESFLSPRERQE